MSESVSQNLNYQVMPVNAQQGEKEPDAVRRHVKDMAAKGFELVEACGDEIRMPSLIFVANAEASKSEYLVEIVPHVKGNGEVDDIRETLLSRNEEGWRVITVLDSPLSPPIGVYKKFSEQPEQLKIVVIPISLFGNIAEVIKQEITQQEIRNHCRLQSIMHSGLTPVLILLSHQGQPEQDYMVEHAKGGLFSNRSNKLNEVVQQHAKDGWRVCGAFEDEALLPCVIFCRDASGS